MSHSEQQRFRKCIIDAILGTDMATHNAMTASLEKLAF